MTRSAAWSDLRDRRLVEPDGNRPFEHEHGGSWLTMYETSAAEVARDGWLLRERIHTCPSCGYELTESQLIGRTPPVS